MDSTPKRVLAVGHASKDLAQEFYPEAVVDVAEKPPKKVLYSALVAVNVLQTVPLRRVKVTLQAWRDCLAEGGVMHVFVPSMDWAAEQILSGDPSPATMIHVFGQEGENRSGFTMLDLRQKFSAAGIPVRDARVGIRVINTNGTEYETDALYICGYKNGHKS